MRQLPVCKGPLDGDDVCGAGLTAGPAPDAEWILLCSRFLLGFSLVMGKGLLLGEEGLCCAVGYWIPVYRVPADPQMLAGLDIFFWCRLQLGLVV